jgi:hypothetical protein
MCTAQRAKDACSKQNACRIKLIDSQGTNTTAACCWQKQPIQLQPADRPLSHAAELNSTQVHLLTALLHRAATSCSPTVPTRTTSPHQGLQLPLNAANTPTAANTAASCCSALGVAPVGYRPHITAAASECRKHSNCCQHCCQLLFSFRNCSCRLQTLHHCSCLHTLPNTSTSCCSLQLPPHAAYTNTSCCSYVEVGPVCCGANLLQLLHDAAEVLL